MRREMKLVKTSCGFCPQSCGMNVYLDQGRIVRVEGMAEHPWSRGLLCPKGEAAAELLYHPERLTRPLRRENGGWRRISWDEALDLIVDKLAEIRERDPRAFATAFGMLVLLSGSVTPALVRLFLYVYGSPNCFSVESMCYRCRPIGYMLTYGRFRVADPENSNCILLWGHNPDSSNPPVAERILQAKQKGARLIVIDPRRTPLAKEAELHLKPRPGSDCALLLSLMQVIISERLYDKGFVKKWTTGFDKLAQHMEAYAPERAEEITWVPAESIRKVARHPIKLMIIAGSNPLLTWPNSRKMAEALSKLELLVVMTQFMSETARLADLVLPAATFLERTELSDYYSLWGVPYVMLRKKVVEPGERWSDLRFWMELARRMGYRDYFPWGSEEEVIDYVLEPSGLTIRYLTEEKPEGLLYDSIKYREYESDGFRTPSGKVELYSETLADQGYDPLPTQRESPESPLSHPELLSEYPLILTTGARQLEYIHSQLRNIPSLHQRLPEPFAEINPETAAKYRIGDGEMIAVETRRGRIELRARVSEDIMPGVISLPHGWAEANVNLLTDGKDADPTIGYPALKSLLCKVEKTGR